MIARHGMFAITLTSFMVVTLFVLLVYPAMFPVNAPPILKTFKDIFVAVLSLAALVAMAQLVRIATSDDAAEILAPLEDPCTYFCVLRC